MTIVKTAKQAKRTVLTRLLGHKCSIDILIQSPTGLNSATSGIRIIRNSDASHSTVDRLITKASTILSTLKPADGRPSLRAEATGLLIRLLPTRKHFVNIDNTNVSIPNSRGNPQSGIVSFLVHGLNNSIIGSGPTRCRIFTTSSLS